MLDLCPVKLIHLGQYLFRKLVPKQPETNSSMLVYADAIPGTSTQEPKQPIPLSTPIDNDIPASEPTLPIPTPYEELETAHTVADMTVQSDNLIEIQDPLPTNLPVSHPAEIDEPPIWDYEPLTDALDKFVNHPDVSFGDEKFWWKGADFADHITTSEIEKTEPDLLQTKIKECTVVLTKLDPAETFPVKLPSLQMEQDLLDIGAYFTHSKRIPKKLRTCRIPRSVSTNITYLEPESSSDGDTIKPKERQSTAPPSDGPSVTRLRAHKSNTVAPKI